MIANNKYDYTRINKIIIEFLFSGGQTRGLRLDNKEEENIYIKKEYKA